MLETQNCYQDDVFDKIPFLWDGSLCRLLLSFDVNVAIMKYLILTLVLLVWTSLAAHAQVKKITGTVTDTDGDVPECYVNVVGTLTTAKPKQESGYFELEVDTAIKIRITALDEQGPNIDHIELKKVQ